MNTGIGDIHNLAYKIAQDYTDPAKLRSSLALYSKERRHIGQVTNALALKNYEKSVKIANSRNLDVKSAISLSNALDKVPIPKLFKKEIQ